MREFNTTGPCNPKLHYTVMREALIEVGKEKVRKGRYFTLFAPRQAGKTTYFQLLLHALKDEGFTPIWISFENLKTLPRERFYTAFNHDLHRELARQHIDTTCTIEDSFGLNYFFETLQKDVKPIVLIIDEFEGIPDAVVSEVMHTFRQIYHQKENYALHSLVLVGVSTIAELIVSSASPFNVTEELQIPYFTFEEVHDLIQQYMTESGQRFEDDVIKAIYDNTLGQPGLVCALCHYLVNDLVADKKHNINIEHFYITLKHFLTERSDINIMNIVQKARQKQAFMLKVLFGQQAITFSVHDPNIGWLVAHGVVDNVNGVVDVSVPLYKKVLITTFRPLINGEMSYYVTSIHDTFQQYLTPEDGLNINVLLEAYRAYIRRRGFRAFDTDHLKEGAWHYSLDGFINFFVESLGGQTYIEVPSGRGRTDILVRYKQQSYVIEIKRFTTNTDFKRGKGQLIKYLKSEGLHEGFYVVFSNLHTDKDELYTVETIEEKQLYTHIILTNFERPSEAPVPNSLRR
ncbi:MAG: hypothetical protein B6242_11255 [Anaerolineaceae bacterium 4572_78]|nr:MAG: hypothetical protein B6242_11255 [Anaerolineaceae bacterium 4572_78]